ncbi:hypothetical protein [Kocuria sp. U4B]
MPDPSRTYLRAYVAAPVAPANGLFQAIHWVFDQDEDLSWDSIGILVPTPAMGEELYHLQRLKGRGVKIGTVAQAVRATAFHGAVIAYAPDTRMLTEAEDINGVLAVAVVAGHNDALGPWVDAHHPQHLGRQRLVARDPFAADPRVRQAMAHLTRHLGPVRRLTDPADVEVVTNTLQQLRATGCRYTPGQLLAAALRLGWPGHHAWALHEAASQVLTDPTAPIATSASTLQPST